MPTQKNKITSLARILAQIAKFVTIAGMMGDLCDPTYIENDKPVWVFYITGFLGMLDGILRECNLKYDGYSRLYVDFVIEECDGATSLGLSAPTLFNTPRNTLLPAFFIYGIFPALTELEIYLNTPAKPRLLNQFIDTSLRALSLLSLFTVINRTQPPTTPIIERDTQLIIFYSLLATDLITQICLYTFRPTWKKSADKVLNAFFELWNTTLLLFQVLMTVSVLLRNNDYFGNWLFAVNASIATAFGILRGGLQYFEKPKFCEHNQHQQKESLELQPLKQRLLPPEANQSPTDIEPSFSVNSEMIDTNFDDTEQPPENIANKPADAIIDIDNNPTTEAPCSRFTQFFTDPLNTRGFFWVKTKELIGNTIERAYHSFRAF